MQADDLLKLFFMCLTMNENCLLDFGKRDIHFLILKSLRSCFSVNFLCLGINIILFTNCAGTHAHSRSTLEVPIFWFIYSEPLLVDKHYQSKALSDMVIVVQSEPSSWESHLQCNGQSLLWNLRSDVRHSAFSFFCFGFNVRSSGYLYSKLISPSTVGPLIPHVCTHESLTLSVPCHYFETREFTSKAFTSNVFEIFAWLVDIVKVKAQDVM